MVLISKAFYLEDIMILYYYLIESLFIKKYENSSVYS